MSATEFRADPYRPAWWLPSPHGQTMGARLLRRPEPPELRRERIDTPDGDFLDLDFTRPSSEDAPRVVLFHGLEGSARRGYALITYQELATHGIGAVGVNFRSCSGEINRAARLYHSGETEDIGFVLQLLHARYGRPLGVIGFSLGGNALLKYLGEQGAAARGRIAAAVAVSVPYDLAAGARLLDGSVMGRFYTRLFVKSLLAKAELKADLLPETCDLDRVRRARSFYEFDDAATAPIHGFASADDYYARSSSGQFIEHIRVPTLLLHSEDDPFVDPATVPRAAIAANPDVQAVITKTGGHVGFMGGSPWRPDFWAERQAARFLAVHLKSFGNECAQGS